MPKGRRDTIATSVLTLTTWERLTLATIVGEVTGAVSRIRIAGRILDVVEFSPAEVESIGLTADGGSVRWTDTRDWSIELNQEGAAFAAATLNEWSGFRAADRKLVLALVEKLERVCHTP